MARNSQRLTLVALAFAVVGVVGYTVFGWRFGGDSSPIALVLAGLAVALAVGSELYDRL